jgi:HrpA-like RNA helicase
VHPTTSTGRSHRRVAEERGAVLGGPQVGYHVGQARHAVSSTKLLFTPAGILLQELRAQGIDALIKFKVIVIDECHERSPESDLVLALVKSLLIQHPHNNSIRIILMSATFDHGRYRKYFQSVPGCEQVDTITLETANSFESFYNRVSTHYLDAILPMLSTDHTTLERSMRRDPNKEMMGGDGGKTLSQQLIALIQSLVAYLDDTDPPEGVFLIFAPTYRHLEQIYQALMSYSRRWKLGVLHSSVDMEYCLHSMQKSRDTHRRKILLASAVADSSVTIPGVTSVIDLCRALQVKWDPDSRNYVPKTVWASTSICDQRKGRTGRTCVGRVFRLIPQGFFISNLESWDVPQLYLSSCRDEVLKLLCTTAKTDPMKVLNGCLDPPPPEVLDGAFDYLESIGACVKGKKKYAATELGELLASLPFLVSDSHTIIRGGQLGILHEALLLRSIASHKPLPIVHHFGESYRNEELLELFYPDVVVSDSKSVNIAHMSAFLFWDAAWNGSRTLAALDQFATSCHPDKRSPTEDWSFSNGVWHGDAYCCDTWKWTPDLEEKHANWCRSHHINPTAVRGISELYITTLSTLYLCSFEPEWLRASNPMSEWNLKTRANQSNLSSNMLRLVYGSKCHSLMNVLQALPGKESTARRLAMEYHGIRDAPSASNPFRDLPQACLPFLQGYCKFGSACRNSHSPFAVSPPCRFFQKGHCSRGDKCMYAHGPSSIEKMESQLSSLLEKASDPMSAIVPVQSHVMLPDTDEWFADPDRQSSLLLLGEGNFEFTESLRRLGCAPAYASA